MRKTMIKIDNEKDLLNILKIISEESVKKAKRTLNESTDDAQQNYLKIMQREESFYGVDLNEKDKKEKSEVDEEDETGAEGEEEEVEDEELGEDELDPEVFGVSFDSVLKDINTLRAGRSTKDKEIKEVNR